MEIRASASRSRSTAFQSTSRPRKTNRVQPSVRDGRLDPEPIAGVPPVHSVRLSGLMEVLPHPAFAQNHLIYVTYTKDVAGNMVATTLARGRLEDLLGHLLDLVVAAPEC